MSGSRVGRYGLPRVKPLPGGRTVRLWPLVILGIWACLAWRPVSALDLPARQYVTVVGSSTAYPIVAAAAEHYGRQPGARTPVVESTGTGGGFKLFCNGLGLQTPDIVMASRAMKASEWARCREHEVTDILELKIGYDGIALVGARDAPQLDLETYNLYLALAKEVPDPAGKPRLVPNPHARWNQIDPDLPDMPIRIYGPPPTSGTRDILVERLMANACAAVDFLSALQDEDERAFRRRCQTLREDGLYIESGEDDARLVRKVIDDPGAVAILGYNFLERNLDRLRGASIDGVMPVFERIESGEYPIARPLYLYVKKAHLGMLPDLAGFVRSLGTPAAWGEEGYLVDKGLIPMPEAERRRWAPHAALGEDSCSYPACP